MTSLAKEYESALSESKISVDLQEFMIVNSV